MFSSGKNWSKDFADVFFRSGLANCIAILACRYRTCRCEDDQHRRPYNRLIISACRSTVTLCIVALRGLWFDSRLILAFDLLLLEPTHYAIRSCTRVLRLFQPSRRVALAIIHSIIPTAHYVVHSVATILQKQTVVEHHAESWQGSHVITTFDASEKYFEIRETVRMLLDSRKIVTIIVFAGEEDFHIQKRLCSSAEQMKYTWSKPEIRRDAEEYGGFLFFFFFFPLD